MVVVGPNSVLTAFQFWILLMLFFYSNAIVSWFLLKGRRNWILPFALLLNCIWNTYNYYPFNWVNTGPKLYILDLVVFVSTLFVFIQHGKRVKT